jgi:hypothetical protein
MFGADAILPAIIISIICMGVAFFALCAFLLGIYLWRKKRWLSLVLLVPSFLYLALFLYVFTPRPLPTHTLVIDLRKPKDLSGIPPGTKWLSEAPQSLKPVVPLSVIGAECDVWGKVNFSIVLPNGQTLKGEGRENYIDVDDTGIWRIQIMAENIPPKKALEILKQSLWPVVLSNESRFGGSDSGQLPGIEKALENYTPKAPIAAAVRLKPPGCNLDFNLNTTFMPSENVSYIYVIELPHVELYQRFTPLPPVNQPEQLIKDCRELLETGKTRTVPEDQWPPSVTQLKPSGVYVKSGDVFLTFDFNPISGAHCYSVSAGDRPTDPKRIWVRSTPYPGLNEVLWHDTFKP